MWRAQKTTPVGKRVGAIRHDLDALQGDVRGLVVDIRDAAASGAVRAIRPAQQTLDTISHRLNGKNGGPSRALVMQAAAIALSLTAGAVVGGLVMRR